VTASPQTAPTLVEAYTEAMSHLVSGLAVVTARAPDGGPCGLLVSSFTSFSARPPSVLMSISVASRSFGALASSAMFGVHVLNAAQEGPARVFAGRGEAKFAGLDWRWDGTVPRLDDALAYLSCVRRRVFRHGDHAVVIGDVTGVGLRENEPLVYHRRRYGWRLHG
jgi:flavin reductase (DIM6/NTAB) family NADH-FMN oxidoreductase RutF